MRVKYNVHCLSDIKPVLWHVLDICSQHSEQLHIVLKSIKSDSIDTLSFDDSIRFVKVSIFSVSENICLILNYESKQK